eukprot:CAMPEP_0198200922 /NCGR_PEP_ID=MMETSP1445-20131203/3804_1 /TAXON_ID=36898 /ORGANISM="Pyramimonas sp., Strain CCMP2087" /LENGTH=262 /DNA_ID=CAMNT_0043871089 /DNA_START=156 /DNA_END=944 /DNA_ORIENTATION=+
MSGVQPAVIVGGGRVGNAMFNLGDGSDTIVRRGEKIPAGTTGPIFVCTRNDVLEGIIEDCPPERREDLVFLQNGMLQQFLETKGLGSNTQALIYFAVAKMGEAPTDGVTDMNPEGLTAVTGKWADALATRLQNGNLSCHVLGEAAFATSMFEKLIWISAFMLVGASHKCSVGEVEIAHKAEVSALIQELCGGITAEKGVAFGAAPAERLCAYARSVAHFPTAVKEFEWRNGYFYSLSEAAVAAGRADPFPTHTAGLKGVGAI